MEEGFHTLQEALNSKFDELSSHLFELLDQRLDQLSEDYQRNQSTDHGGKSKCVARETPRNRQTSS